MGLMALLLHELPDGTHHHDWLLQRDKTDPPLLMTFRVPDRIDSVTCNKFLAQRLPDHRLLYLTYEGPVHGRNGNSPLESDSSSDRPRSSAPDAMGDRGRVKRLASGQCRILKEDPEHVVIQSCFGSQVFVEWQGRRLTPDETPLDTHAPAPDIVGSAPQMWLFVGEKLEISLGD
jgi:hypothetical protein